jgi:stalled ribosome alternative rescue factor ArfA
MGVKRRNGFELDSLVEKSLFRVREENKKDGQIFGKV